MANYSLVHLVRVCTEFTPETFGRLTTLGPKFRLPVGKQGQHTVHQVCICQCGIITVIRHGLMRNKNTTSCGCARREASTTHGESTSITYSAWLNMRARCDNPNSSKYDRYGGRGIGYCERWKKFENFFADMGHRPDPGHTLDRFPDSDGNYEPSNCRWADWETQNNNKSNNNMLTIAGKADTLANWIRASGLHSSTVRNRIARGWDPIKALSVPVSSCRDMLTNE